MISYHPTSDRYPVGKVFTAGYKTYDKDNPYFIAQIIKRFAWSPGVFKDGYRNQENFQYADWIALDFDDSPLSLEQALNIFSDMIHIIGTTRNHQKYKNGKVKDRFRIVLKNDNRCSDFYDYKYTLSNIIEKHEADDSCSDPSKHYFRCIDIVSINKEGYCEEIQVAPEEFRKEEDPQEILLRIRKSSFFYAKNKSFPFHIEKFLKTGEYFADSRNRSVFVTAMHMLECGLTPKEIISRIESSPFPRNNRWKPNDVAITVKSAVKNLAKKLGTTHKEI